MKIIDAFPFFNEIDTLKIRLSLLYEKVDIFVICESNITYSGLSKSYNFLEHKSEFLPWLDKIVFLKYEPDTSDLDFSKKDSTLNPSSAPWIVEKGQRNFLSSFLSWQDSSDIAIICDVDEIWNPNISDLIMSGKIPHEATRLQMQLHYYWLNCVGLGVNNSKWTHPFFANIGFIKINPNLDQIRTQAQLPILEDAGWHFSYLGGAKKISEKINAFAHQEANTIETNNLKHLERCINHGIDYLNRPGHDYAFRQIDYYPEELRKEMKKYPQLIKTTMSSSTPYHENFNNVVLDLIPKTALKIVDIGCMNGILGREFKKIVPDSFWIGIEINSEYAELARNHLNKVIVDNIESENFQYSDEIRDADCFVFADVLEHLYKPWDVIEKIRGIMKETAVVIACIPNAQNFSVIGRLLSGEFVYEDQGLMDRTHIRWFTRRTFLDLFERAGFRIETCMYMSNSIPDPMYINSLKTAALSYNQTQIEDTDFTTYQWVIRAIPNY